MPHDWRNSCRRRLLCPNSTAAASVETPEKLSMSFRRWTEIENPHCIVSMWTDFSWRAIARLRPPTRLSGTLMTEQVRLTTTRLRLATFVSMPFVWYSPSSTSLSYCIVALVLAHLTAVGKVMSSWSWKPYRAAVKWCGTASLAAALFSARNITTRRDYSANTGSAARPTAPFRVLCRRSTFTISMRTPQSRQRCAVT